MNSIGSHASSGNRPTSEQIHLIAADSAVRQEIKAAQIILASYSEGLRLGAGGRPDFNQIDDVIRTGEILARVGKNLRRAAMAASEDAAQRRHEFLGAVLVYPLVHVPKVGG